jgi:hypothetical protein
MDSPAVNQLRDAARLALLLDEFATARTPHGFLTSPIC